MNVKSILNVKRMFIAFLIIAVLCSVASVSAVDPQLNHESFGNGSGDSGLDNNTTLGSVIVVIHGNGSGDNGTPDSGLDNNTTLGSVIVVIHGNGSGDNGTCSTYVVKNLEIPKFPEQLNSSNLLSYIRLLFYTFIRD